MFARSSFPKIVGAVGGGTAIFIGGSFIASENVRPSYHQSKVFFDQPFQLLKSERSQSATTNKDIIIEQLVAISGDQSIISISYDGVQYISDIFSNKADSSASGSTFASKLPTNPSSSPSQILVYRDGSRYGVEAMIPNKNKNGEVVEDENGRRGYHVRCERAPSKREEYVENAGDLVAVLLIGAAVGGMAMRSTSMTMRNYYALKPLKLGDRMFIGVMSAFAATPVAVIVTPSALAWRHYLRVS
jgi:hypothetical protein